MKQPKVDSKVVDGASAEELKQGFLEVAGDGPRDYAWNPESRTITGKGVAQDARGGFVGRAHGWDR
jgi:hypothetical protein